jgi:hypothetical protein
MVSWVLRRSSWVDIATIAERISGSADGGT